MMLARKISRAKWVNGKGLKAGELPADAVTADLRTKDNALSFWQCEDDSEDHLKLVSLAIAAAGERLDKVDIVWLNQQDLVENDLQIEKTKGRTTVKSMVDKHVDVPFFDYVRLGTVAGLIAESLTKCRHRRFSKKDVKKLLQNAIENEILDPNDLQEKLRNEILK